MKNIPYGYKIVNGEALVDEIKANQIKELFTKYLEGYSLASAAKLANLSFNTSQIGHMLKKVIYLGDEFFPNIISREIFEQAQEERRKRATRLGRNNKAKASPKITLRTNFKMATPTKKYSNSLEQAQYLYSLIEVEEQSHDE